MQTKTAKIIGICLAFMLFISNTSQTSKAQELQGIIDDAAIIRAIDNALARNSEKIHIASAPSLESGIGKSRRNSTDSSDPEVLCLAKVVYYEAGNQSFKGKQAVAELAVNRSKNDAFPKRICAVIKQKGQFTSKVRRTSLPKLRNAADKKAWQDSVRAASEAITHPNQVVPQNVLYFHERRTKPPWIKRMRLVVRIDDHVFYAKKKG